MNINTIATDRFSNPESCDLYFAQWPDEPVCKTQQENGDQCGGCSFFAPFNSDYGLCAHPKSRHHLETVFEHFTCPAFVNEGWGPHSFTEEKDFHCRCKGEGAEHWNRIAATSEPKNEPKG